MGTAIAMAVKSKNLLAQADACRELSTSPAHDAKKAWHPIPQNNSSVELACPIRI
jgi:hypothetical protein